MIRTIFALGALVALAVGLPWAAAQDLAAPVPPDCPSALEALKAQEETILRESKSGRGPDVSTPGRNALEALAALRRRAARSCLGSDARVPLPQHAGQGPIRVPPVGIPRPGAVPIAPPTTRPGPPAAQPSRPGAPVIVTTCDPVGCWASDGTRLVRAGPNLLGPRGLCTAPGGILHCP